MELTFRCPACAATLEQGDFGFGVAWTCPGCQGRAVTVSLLRQGVERAFMNSLWQEARRQQQGLKGNRQCPSCSARMVVVALTVGEGSVSLDVCPTCQFVWFDHRESEALPMDGSSKQREVELTPAGKEALALAKVERMRDEGRHWDDWPAADHWGLGYQLGKILWQIFSD